MNSEDLGIIEYGEAWEYQQKLFDEAIGKKKLGEIAENKILLCEHPHVITKGKNSESSNVLFSEEMLRNKGVSLFQIDRGGDVTYHGPGQLVGYPILDLESLGIGLRQYIYNVEEVIIRFLNRYKLRAGRLKSAPGIWLDFENEKKARKICAIGVKSSHFVTMHGFALNVNTDLNYFSLINPCGFTDKGVTSIEKEIGAPIDMGKVKTEILEIFAEVF